MFENIMVKMYHLYYDAHMVIRVIHQFVEYLPE